MVYISGKLLCALQVLPIHPNTGWNLEGIHNGIRVFSRQLDSLQSYSSEKHLVAASLILDGTLKVTSGCMLALMILHPLCLVACCVACHICEGDVLLDIRPSPVQPLPSFSSTAVLCLLTCHPVHHDAPAPCWGWSLAHSCLEVQTQDGQCSGQVCTFSGRIAGPCTTKNHH